MRPKVKYKYFLRNIGVITYRRNIKKIGYHIILRITRQDIV